MAAMGARVLIVEDDERIRLSLQLVLEDEGHAVELAESAEAGLEALARAHREHRRTWDPATREQVAQAVEDSVAQELE